MLPQLLILDERTNGLDPAGIRDIRTMIRLLGTIIGGGRMLASGPVRELVSEHGVRSWSVVVADPAAAEDVLTRARYRVRRDGDRLALDAPPLMAAPGATPERATGAFGEDTSRVLADQWIHLRELRPAEADLESVFLALTSSASLHAGQNTDQGAA